MSEVVERVARRLDPLAWAALGLADTEKLAFRRQRSLEHAVVAISAMREPSDSMMARAILPATVKHPCSCAGIAATTPSIRPIWQAMIDSALSDGKGETK